MRYIQELDEMLSLMQKSVLLGTHNVTITRRKLRHILNNTLRYMNMKMQCKPERIMSCLCA
jgi:hypothetical protein